MEPALLPDTAAAVMVALPVATEVTCPLEPAALLTGATDVADELQVTDVVMSCVLLSKKVPVAVNCSVVPRAMPGLAAVTAMDASVAELTVRILVPDMLPKAAVIVAAPAATGVTCPLDPDALLTSAMDVADELQVTDVVMSCVLLSEKVPVAVNCSVVPRAIRGLVGVTAMDLSVVELTVKILVPDMLPKAAVIVAVPAATDVACPLEPAALLIVATDAADELQVTDVVISCVLLSEKVPVALNCSVVLRAMPGLAGVTVMDASVAELTVRILVPDMLPDAAVIVAVPAATGVICPLEPAALPTVATVVADELQVTDAVMSCVLLSEKIPVAVNCSVVPRATRGLVGVTAMDLSVAELTIRVVEPEMLPEVAVMVAVPAATDVACPLEPAALLIVATDAADELQVTDVVMSCVLLSEKVPVAENCSVVPGAMPGLVGVTAIETSVVDELLPLRSLLQEYRKGEVMKKKITNKQIIFALLFLFHMTALLSRCFNMSLPGQALRKTLRAAPYPPFAPVRSSQAVRTAVSIQ